VEGLKDAAASVKLIDITTIVSGNAEFGRKISRENKDKYGKSPSLFISHQVRSIMSDERNSIFTALRADSRAGQRPAPHMIPIATEQAKFKSIIIPDFTDKHLVFWSFLPER
jgi:hypothetical protein